MKPVITALMLALAACATARQAAWDADRWLRQDDNEVSASGWQFSAAPVRGDGFKLKLSLKTDGLFRPAGADEVATIEDFEAAARAAAPEGCVLERIDLTADRGAVAAYACD
jgi:hypothetical protein